MTDWRERVRKSLGEGQQYYQESSRQARQLMDSLGIPQAFQEIGFQIWQAGNLRPTFTENLPQGLNTAPVKSKYTLQYSLETIMTIEKWLFSATISSKEKRRETCFIRSELSAEVFSWTYPDTITLIDKISFPNKRGANDDIVLVNGFIVLDPSQPLNQRIKDQVTRHLTRACQLRLALGLTIPQLGQIDMDSFNIETLQRNIKLY